MRQGKRFQFTLRQMMVAVSAAAVASAFFILLFPELWALAVDLIADKATKRMIGKLVFGGLLLVLVIVAAGGLRICLLTLGRKRMLSQDDGVD